MTKVLSKVSDGTFHFYCVACEVYHGFNSAWEFNGDMEKPTVNPSLLTKWNDGKTGKENVCHLYINDGKFNYLPDCTHIYAGKTVPMVEVQQ